MKFSIGQNESTGYTHDHRRKDSNPAPGFDHGCIQRIMTYEILCGDALTRLKSLPDESFHCCITSPPYWNLRDYGVACQLGLEKTPEEYIARMVEIFREVKRVLRNDGTLWVNIGDSYAASGRGGGGGSLNNEDVGKKISLANSRRAAVSGYKQKDLIGIPWVLAFALRAEGWFLRQDIIWNKPNPMPESVRDRCTKSHEYIFLLSKSRSYYFDSKAISEPASPDTDGRYGRAHSGYAPTGQAPHRGILSPRDNEKNFPSGWANSPNYKNQVPGHPKRGKGNSRTFRGGIYLNNEAFNNSGERTRNSHGNAENPTWRRNKRSVWTIAVQGFSEAHFATFPEALVESCLFAGCPQGGTVLDPFCGSGTVGVVALKSGRHFTGIELNPQYVEMAQRRIQRECGFLTVEA